MTDLIIEARLAGPLFDDRGLLALDRLTDDLQGEVAASAYAAVMTNLNASIKVPTPYYETQVTTDRVVADYVVHDRGIVYGPWLEGVSERNAATRFKGYASFRRAWQAANADVPHLAEVVLQRHLRGIS